MTRPVLTMLAVLLPFSLGFAQSAPEDAPALGWQSVEGALASAQQSGKKILVDVYAPWCGWCRKLAQEVHTDPAVRRYLAAHFEAARLNGDDAEGKHRFKGITVTGTQLAQALGVSGFPTTLFLESGGDAVITRIPGYLDAGEYLQVLRYIGSDAFRTQSYEEYLRQIQP